MPDAVEVFLTDPGVAAVRARLDHFVRRHPDAARASFTVQCYGRLSSAAMAHLGAAADALDERAERARDHLNGDQIGTLDRVEAALPDLAGRRPAFDDDERAAAMRRVDAILPDPNRRPTAAEEAARVATIRDLAAQGLAVVFASSDLIEVMNVADRIIVLSGGRITLDARGGDVDEKAVVAAANAQLETV